MGCRDGWTPGDAERLVALPLGHQQDVREQEQGQLVPLGQGWGGAHGGDMRLDQALKF